MRSSQKSTNLSIQWKSWNLEASKAQQGHVFFRTEMWFVLLFRCMSYIFIYVIHMLTSSIRTTSWKRGLILYFSSKIVYKKNRIIQYVCFHCHDLLEGFMSMVPPRVVHPSPNICGSPPCITKPGKKGWQGRYGRPSRTPWKSWLGFHGL